MFEEQVGWAVDAGVDFVIGETFSWRGEALIALEESSKSGKPVVVITLAMHKADVTREDWTSPTPASGSPTPAPTSSG